MKRLFIAIISLTLILTALAGADVIDKNKGSKGERNITARPQPDYLVHDVGNVWSATSNFGNYGDPNSGTTKRPSAEWPAGTQTYYIWEGRFWVGAIVGGDLLVSHADYGNYEFEPTEGTAFSIGPAVSSSKSIQDSWCVYDDLEEAGGHTPIGMKIVQRGLTWSMPEYADFIAYEYYIINISGGTLNGVIPCWVFDNDVCSGDGGDADQPHIDDLVDYDGYAYPESSNPFKYDMVENLDYDGDGITQGYDDWGWPYGRGDIRAGVPLNPNYNEELVVPDGIWDEYQVYVDDNGPIILRHYSLDGFSDTLKWQDGQGNETDPIYGWLIPRNTSYMYDSDYPASSENDVGERALGGMGCAGFIGGRIIWSDLFTNKFGYPEGYQKTAEDTVIRPYVHQWWNWESDPGSDEEKFQYMEGSHSASLGQKFLPHPFNYLAGAPTFDYRYLSSTGPFNGWADGDTIRLVYAYGVGLGLQGMREVLDNSIYAYYSGSVWSNPGEPSNFDEDAHWQLPAPPAIPSLSYSPADQLVNLVWDNKAEHTVDPFLGLVDFEGYKIYRSKYNTSAWELIFACDNRDDSVYVFNTDGDTMRNNAGNIVKVNLPPVTGFYVDPVSADTIYNNHIFRDRGGLTPWNRTAESLINGLPYYYTVVAYDFEGTESAKSNYAKTSAGAPSPVYPRSVPPAGANDLSKVKVVPNPYKGTHIGEPRYSDFVRFIHLPRQCKISVFTLTGDLVREIYHNDANSAEEQWNLISRSEQSVVSGLYLYVVETDDDKKIGKMLIIR